jgi:hypothetical protein
MMCPYMVFTLVISKIFLAWMPLDIVCILGHLITHPKILHLHQAQSLTFDGVVGNAYSSGIVAMDGSFRLWVTQFFEGKTKYHSLLALEEESAEFCLGG